LFLITHLFHEILNSFFLFPQSLRRKRITTDMFKYRSTSVASFRASFWAFRASLSSSASWRWRRLCLRRPSSCLPESVHFVSSSLLQTLTTKPVVPSTQRHGN